MFLLLLLLLLLLGPLSLTMLSCLSSNYMKNHAGIVVEQRRRMSREGAYFPLFSEQSALNGSYDRLEASVLS